MEKLLKKIENLQKSDAFIQGSWMDDETNFNNAFRGSITECVMQTRIYSIRKFAKKYGIDIWYCHMIETIFEGLPDGEYQKFPLECIKKIKVGTDFNKIKSKWFQLLLKDQQYRFTEKGSSPYRSIQKCIDLFDVPFNEINADTAWAAAEYAKWLLESPRGSKIIRDYEPEAAIAVKAAYAAATSAVWRDNAEIEADRAAWTALFAGARPGAHTGDLWSVRGAKVDPEYYSWMRDKLYQLIEEQENF